MGFTKWKGTKKTYNGNNAKEIISFINKIDTNYCFPKIMEDKTIMFEPIDTMRGYSLAIHVGDAVYQSSNDIHSSFAFVEKDTSK